MAATLHESGKIPSHRFVLKISHKIGTDDSGRCFNNLLCILSYMFHISYIYAIKNQGFTVSGVQEETIGIETEISTGVFVPNFG